MGVAAGMFFWKLLSHLQSQFGHFVSDHFLASPMLNISFNLCQVSFQVFLSFVSDKSDHLNRLKKNYLCN